MIIGLNGWVNAGEVSTFSVKYLIDKLNAEKVGEVSSERFYVYQVQRPLVVIKRGLVQEYSPLKNDIFCWKNEEKETGLVFLLGVEPHLDWSDYSRAVLDIAENLGVRRIYTLGGYLVDASLAGEPVITGSSIDDRVLAKLRRVGIELVDYSGPTSVYSEILWQSKSRGISVVSLWCAVPFYGEGMNPKAAYNLLSKLKALLNLKIDLNDLKREADSFINRISTRTQERVKRLAGGLEKRPSFLI